MENTKTTDHFTAHLSNHTAFLAAVQSIAKDKVLAGATLTPELLGECMTEALEQQEALIAKLTTDEGHQYIARKIYDAIHASR